MDVRERGRSGGLPDPAHTATQRPCASMGHAPLEHAQVAHLLVARRLGELRLARGFRECRSLSDAQLEDLYQDATLALLEGDYQSETHLLNTLRTVIKRRALNLRRDEHRREEILTENAPGIHALQNARNAEQSPEQQALLHADRLLITEFLAELTKDERRFYVLLAEGIKYHRIAAELNITVNEARNATRSYERKRERFQLLYEAGRLCGYRADIVRALQSGQATSEDLAQRAIAHIDNCAYCRAQHKTNAKRLRAAFERQAAALLPLPALTARIGWQQRLGLRLRLLLHRLMPWTSSSPGGARQRTTALLAGGGATAKVATTIVAAAVIAGGTVGVTHQLQHHPRTHRHPRPGAGAHTMSLTPERTTPAVLQRASLVSRPRKGRPGHVLAPAHTAASHTSETRREPGGFAYLGVPRSARAPAQESAPARAATSSTGGPFSP
jgi:RNA polymerase sigma factor (sigma-70 family)